jgi:hypothetical protein
MFRLELVLIRQRADQAVLTAKAANLANDPLRHLALSNVGKKVLIAQLISAAMQACDKFGDDELAREAMKLDCLAVPLDSRADLLDHFSRNYAKR